MSLTRNAIRARRLSRTVRAFSTGHGGRRVKNIALGRALGRASWFAPRSWWR